MKKPPYDIIGHKFGKRTVLRYVGLRAGKQYRSVYRFIVECDCGRKDIVDGARLRGGWANQCKTCSMAELHTKRKAARSKELTS